MTAAADAGPAQREPELAGQTVVVIGGSAGIGLETARRSRAEGAKVIITGRNPDRLIQAAQDVDAESTAAAAGRMPPGGTLVFMGGTGGRRVGHGLGIASAATAALPAFTATLAMELAPIRVNLIAAGFVDTPLSASLLGNQLEHRRQELTATLPIGRVVTPADVAAIAVHLMINTAITGATYASTAEGNSSDYPHARRAPRNHAGVADLSFTVVIRTSSMVSAARPMCR
jgi:NAD(P)-dependent dehydrogenase (short-subunit alcohol dehydrogenase family)